MVVLVVNLIQLTPEVVAVLVGILVMVALVLAHLQI
jgi:preprotein translocase subunit Sec61beta